MTLRRQLLLASLLLLTLPWAGCQFVREMEGVMRDGQAQSLKATARAVAAGIAAQPSLLYPDADRLADTSGDGGEIYAPPSRSPIILDGYGDGWPEDGINRITNDGIEQGFELHYQALTHGNTLYLLLRVKDTAVTYYHPSGPPAANGDRLVLQVNGGEAIERYTLLTSAPGQMHVYRLVQGGSPVRDRRIRGIWQDAEEGYVLELAIPLDLLGGRLGFYIVDAATDGDGKTFGNIRPGYSATPPWLVTFPPDLSLSLGHFASPGLRLVVTDRAKWIIGRAAGPTAQDLSPASTFWLLRLVFRSILKPHPYRQNTHPDSPGRRDTFEVEGALAGREQVSWYRSDQSLPVMAGAAPIRSEGKVIGVVVAERNSEEYLSLTDRAVSKLLTISLLAVAISGLGLLAFAGVLSWRIRKLSHATSQVLDKRGQLTNSFPRSRQRDEIGDLSRDYADLLDRLREYHEYLRGLSRKLSHELRTPIAVIRSSLEHLEQGEKPGEVYLIRAREGLARLNAILSGMGEATRLEESIRADSREQFDLVGLLAEVCTAYGDIYRTHVIERQVAPQRALIDGSPELLVQCLDKLVDNACSFAPKGSTIGLTLTDADSNWLLAVENTGPPLPATMNRQLFDSLVSVREASGDRLHLGLGLHIARLVVDYHRGTIIGENLKDGSGVRFSIRLPKSTEAAV